MDEIESLRRRAEQAQQRIGRSEARPGQMSDRVAELVQAVDAEIAEQADVIDRHKADIARLNGALDEAKGQVQQLNQENEQIRAILKSLLQAIEGDGAAGLGETMVQLETKVSALIAEDGMDVAPVDDPADAVVELGDEDMPELHAGSETVELGETDPVVQDQLLEDEAINALDAEPEPQPESEVAMDEPSEIVDDDAGEPVEMAAPDDAVDPADTLLEADAGTDLGAEDAGSEMPDAVLEEETETLSDDHMDVADTVGRYLQEDGEADKPDVAAPVSAIGDIVERLKSENQLSTPEDSEALAS